MSRSWFCLILVDDETDVQELGISIPEKSGISTSVLSQISTGIIIDEGDGVTSSLSLGDAVSTTIEETSKALAKPIK